MNGNGAAASYGDLLVTSLLVLVAVCVAAFVVVRLAGRFLATGRARGAHLLDVVARLPLEPRRSLYVVEVAGKTLLVGTSEMGLSVLSELDAAEVRARAVPRVTFADLVRNAWLRRSSARASSAGAPAEESPGAASPSGASSAGASSEGASSEGASSAGTSSVGSSAASVAMTSAVAPASRDAPAEREPATEAGAS